MSTQFPKVGQFVTPGEVLFACKQGAGPIAAGSGAYNANGFICASLCGNMQRSGSIIWVDNALQRALGHHAHENLVSVEAIAERSSSLITLKVGDLVTARVTQIDRTRANLDILCLDGEPLAERYTAILPQTSMKSVVSEVRRSYRPGDVVVAKIISMGDAKKYVVTTASDELGVVQAYSAAAGAEMKPMDFKRMQCPVTGTIEEREVAKPVWLNSST